MSFVTFSNRRKIQDRPKPSQKILKMRHIKVCLQVSQKTKNLFVSRMTCQRLENIDIQDKKNLGN